MKKVLSILLSLTLLLSLTITMCIPASAEEGPIYVPSSVTLTEENSDTTVKAPCKLYDFTYDLKNKKMYIDCDKENDSLGVGIPHSDAPYDILFRPKNNSNKLVYNYCLLTESSVFSLYLPERMFWEPVYRGKIDTIWDNCSAGTETFNFKRNKDGKIVEYVHGNSIAATNDATYRGIITYKGNKIVKYLEANRPVNFKYNKKGQLTTVSDEFDTVKLSYNKQGLLTDIPNQRTFHYNSSGEMTSMDAFYTYRLYYDNHGCITKIVKMEYDNAMMEEKIDSVYTISYIAI